MKFVHLLLRWLSSLFLHGALLLLFASISVIFLFGNRQVIKDSLVESRIYTTIVPSFIEDNRKSNEGKRSVLPYEDQRLTEIAENTFPSNILRLNAEKAVDGIYDWVNGDSEVLSFAVNLEDEKQQFIERVSTFAAEYVGSLPLCQTNEIPEVTIFELECRPENVPLQFVKDKMSADLRSSDTLKAEFILTEQNLPKTEDGTLVYEKVLFLPSVMQFFNSYLWLFIVVFVIAAGLFVKARKTYRKGFQSLGRDLLSNGATLIIATVIFGFVLPTVTDTFTLQGNDTITQINTVTEILTRRFDIIIINTALQIIALAVLIIVLERMSRPQSMYAGLARRSGMSSSIGKSIRNDPKTFKSPPVQTSETKKKPKKRTKKPKKYRKMGL